MKIRAGAAVIACVATALLITGSVGATASPPDGTQQGSFFGPCDWGGPGAPPIETCTNTAPAVTAACNPTGISTISFTKNGFIPTGGSFSEVVTATIGPQDGPPAPAFQPFGFTGAQVGSIGLSTGPLLTYDASFTINLPGGTTVTGTKSVVPDLANNGVCLEPNDETVPSAVFPFAMTGFFYILDAQVLSYDATITDVNGTTSASGDAEAYLSDTFGTFTVDPSHAATADGFYMSGFGTTHPATGVTTSAETPIGTGVSVVPAPGVSLTFDNVTAAGTTSVTELTTVPPLPAGFQAGDPPAYYELTTDATFDNVEVCVPYGSPPAGTTPHLLHYTGGAWVEVPSSFNDLTRIICGSVSSFSPFAAVFVPNAPQTKAECKNGGWQHYPGFKNQGDCVSWVATHGTH